MELSTRSENVYLPEGKEINAAVEIATSREAAEYLHERLEAKLASARMAEKCSDLLGNVQTFVESVDAQTTRTSKPWEGDTRIRTPFENINYNLGVQAAQTIGSQGGENAMFLAIDDNTGQFLQGFTHDGVPITADMTDNYEKLFHSWLAQNGLIAKSSTFFAADPKGQAIQENNQSKVANLNALRERFNDPEQGFEKHCQNLGVSIKTHEVAYPAQQPKAAAAKAPVAAPQPVQSAPQQPEPTPDVNPETQSPTSGS